MVTAPKSSLGGILAGEIKTSAIELVNGIIYGGINAGKSFLLGTASWSEVLQPCLIVTFDRMDPTLSLFKDKPVKVIDAERVCKDRNITISSFMETLIKELRQEKRFKFVGLDNISKLYNPLLLRSVLAEALKNTHHNHDKELLEQQDYLRATTRLYDWMDAIRGISQSRGFHLFVTARERSAYIEAPDFTGDIFYPDLSPEVRRLISHEFDFCFRMTVDTRLRKNAKGKTERREVRYLYTLARMGTVIKSRGEKLPDKLVDPTAERICMGLLGKHTLSGSQDTESLEENLEENLKDKEEARVT